jgi:hypothetical protein
MKNEYIIIAILVIVILFFIWNNNKEHLTGNEAVFNIAKVYADATGTVNFNNIRTTGNANFNKITGVDVSGGNLDVSGIARFNKFTALDKADGYVDVSGNLEVFGFANFRGASTDNPTNMKTHFPNSDGKNYIRGTTQIDGGSILNGPLVVNAPVSLGRGFYARSPDGSKSLHLGNDAKLYIFNGTEKVWSSS